MTPAEGRGVQAWVKLANAALSALSREKALELVNATSHEEFASMAVLASAGGVAVHGETGGNLFYESMADRLAAVGKPAMSGVERRRQLEVEAVEGQLRRAELRKSLKEGARK